MYDSTLDTQNHIERVSSLIDKINYLFFLRAQEHDRSKLHAPEKKIFDEYSPKLKELTYGSKEYNECLSKMKEALNHHYKKNRHHPEHFKNGISDMNLIDILEMLCDWKAASERHDNGNIKKSIEINQKRFNYSNDLKNIFLNTLELFE